MHDDSGEASAEEWPDEAPPPEGQPVLAVIFGSVAMILLAIFVPAPTTATMGEEMLVALGVGLPVAALAWGIGYLVTIRHASANWKLASAALLALVGLVAADRAIYAANEALRFDLLQLAEIRPAAQGFFGLPPQFGKPLPVTSRFIAYLREEEADRRDTESKLGALKVHYLATAWHLRKDGEILDHCERTGPAKRLLGGYAARRDTRAKALIADMAAVNAPARTRAELDAAAKQRSGAESLRRAAEIDAALLDQLAERCRILARRHWETWGYSFLFRDGGELEAFNANAERQIALMRDPRAHASMIARALASPAF